MRDSPYNPGAGRRPPVLAGRGALLEQWELGLNDLASRGRDRARDTVLVGPRGVGKTVLLSAFADTAAGQGLDAVLFQATPGQAGFVAALADHAAKRIAADAGPWTTVRRAIERVSGVSLAVAGVSAGIELGEPAAVSGPPPSRYNPSALADLLAEVALGIRADAPLGGLLLTIDEMQAASSSDLALLAATLQRLNVEHSEAPVVFAGTGLPHTMTVLTRAGVTHPDRLFEVDPLPTTLSRSDAHFAVAEPARRAGVTWDPQALADLFEATRGYPAYVQVFADATWTAAAGPRQITSDDVAAGVQAAGRRLEARRWQPRLAELTDRETEMIAAVAVLGGAATARELEALLGRGQTEFATVRRDLIADGDLVAPVRGRLELTDPFLGRYVLAHYERQRTLAAVALTPLAVLHERTEALPARDAAVLEARSRWSS